MEELKEELVVFQADNGALQLRKDIKKETVWASVKQIAVIFGIDRSVASRHISNILKNRELDKEVVCANFAHTTQHGAISNKSQTRTLNYYNLDIILSVGYRTKSAKAIQFRRWANEVLKQHITQGFTINPKVVERNRAQFLKTIEDLKLLSRSTSNLDATDVLSLIQNFSHTWFSLENYDKGNFPSSGTEEELELSAEELIKDLQELKANLVTINQATSLFGQEKRKGAMEGIFTSVFQSIFGQDAYPSIEEKAAHLLYFTVKNHPFNDGNKRSGAFCFIWLLQKANYPFSHKITPEALTTLTLLIAESDPMEKDKLIGLILLLLNG